MFVRDNARQMHRCAHSCTQSSDRLHRAGTQSRSELGWMLGHRARGVGRARGRGMWVMVFALRLTLGMDTVCVTKCAA